ncbi:hypothetical protein DAH51_08365 [Sphingobium yanoikuyae]|uniref:Uncharacterized protein n=1 Tax=Sphingobium yanoikuyae TaxID=13690 RepID=A0A430BYC4_SPHYA|nr:hypothetical protein DAH51_08365 [Sphingobium yanoikuyae]
MTGRTDARRDVGHGQLHAIDELAFEAAVDTAIAGVTAGIVAAPAVRMDRVMQRLGAVTDIMAKADRLEGAMLGRDGYVAPFGLRLADMAHADDEPVIGLNRGIGQSAGPADIGARGGRRIAVLDRLIAFVERQDEFVARARDRLHEAELLAEPAMIGVFLHLGEILRIPAPAVGQRGGGGDIVGIGLKEDRAVLRDGVERGAIDHRMGGAAPGHGGAGAERQRTERQGQGQFTCHHASLQGSSGSRGSTRADRRDGRNSNSVGVRRAPMAPG